MIVTRRRIRSRGVALLMVLWVVLVSGLMLAGVMNAARVQVALAHDDLAAVQSHWLARAGVEQALAVLEDDDPVVDTSLEHWYHDDALFKDVSLGGGTFAVGSAIDNGRAGIDDESARINLNVADTAQLKKLKTLSDAQISHLMEWRTPRSGGANRDTSVGNYYQTLRYPYEMRRKDLQTHRELLLVQGFEDRKFFGDFKGSLAAGGPAALTTIYSYQPLRDAQGKARLNFNTATAQQLQDRFNFTPQLAAGVIQARRGRFQDLASLLNVTPQQSAGGASSPNSSEPLVAQLTLPWLAAHLEQISLDSDERLPGKININTASREVLTTLPGVTDEIADRIIGQRDTSDGDFKTLGEVLDRNVVDAATFRGFFDRLTTRSDVFSVESLGVSPGGVSRRILAVIDRGQTPMKILYWYQT